MTVLATQRLVAILPAVQAVFSSMDPEEVLEAMVRRTREIQGVTAAAVFECDETSSRLRVHTSSGLSKSYIRAMIVPVGSLAVGKAFQTGQIEVVGDIDADPSFHRYLQRMHRERLGAIVAAPLIARQKLLGILAIYFSEPFTPGEEDKDAVRALCSLGALALDNALLYRAQREVTAKLEKLSAQLYEQSERLSRALKAHEWLVRTVLVHDGLDAVTSALAEFVGGPVIVEDTRLNVIGFALPKSWTRESINIDRANAGLARFAEDSRVQEHLSVVKRRREPSLLDAIPEIGLETARMTAPVSLGEQPVVFISVLSSDASILESMRLLLEQGALAVALELMKSRSVFEAEQRARGDFLQDLLRGQIDSIDDCGALVAASKFELAALQRVLSVRIDDDVTSDRHGSVRHIFHFLEPVVLGKYPKSLVVLSKDTFIVLLGADRPISEAAVREVGERIVMAVGESLSPATVSVGFGGEIRNVREVRRSYNEATRALEVANILGKAGSVIAFSDLGIFEILLRLGKPEDLQEFVRRYIGRLIQYDDKQGGELLSTLEKYFQRNYSLTETARDLCLHLNGVKYRLQRIEQVCGVDLRDAEDLMNLQLALRLHKLRV